MNILRQLEPLNETYEFSFDNDPKTTEILTSSAFYLALKKAFTPYILKQMHMAKAYKKMLVIKEKIPLVKYKLELRIPQESSGTNQDKKQ